MNGLEITSSYLAFKEHSIHLAILVTNKLNNKKHHTLRKYMQPILTL